MTNRIFVFLTVIFLFLSVFSRPARAVTYELVAPSGPLQSGQDVQFIVNIDTEGDSMTTSSVGMTFDTQYLEYVSTDPGETFSTVTADLQGTDRLILTGNSSGGFTGSGSFATVTFNIIAANPGSTTLCTLFVPEMATPTPTTVSNSTPTPTITPGGPTLTPTPTITPGGATAAPTAPNPTATGIVPTSLPVSGFSPQTYGGLIFATAAVFLVTAGMIISKRI